MSQALEFLIRLFITVPDDELAHIVSCFKHKRIRKDEYLLRAGEVCKDLVFVESGSIRMYYMNGDIEISAWFSLAGSVAMEIQSFISEEPSICSIHAIEDSEVWVLPKQELEHLYTTHPVVNDLMRKVWEAALVMVIPRFSSLQNDSAIKRYKDLMNDPILLQQIPQKYLASFIGVTPTSLSRIRKKLLTH